MGEQQFRYIGIVEHQGYLEKLRVLILKMAITKIAQIKVELMSRSTAKKRLQAVIESCILSPIEE
jgi:hypothetical protein